MATWRSTKVRLQLDSGLGLLFSQVKPGPLVGNPIAQPDGRKVERLLPLLDSAKLSGCSVPKRTCGARLFWPEVLMIAGTKIAAATGPELPSPRNPTATAT